MTRAPMPDFTPDRRSLRPGLNEAADRLNDMLRFVGDEYVNVSESDGMICVSLNVERLLERVS